MDRIRRRHAPATITPVRRSVRPIPPDARERAISDEFDGVPSRAVAVALGVSHAAVNRWRRAAGRSRPRGRAIVAGLDSFLATPQGREMLPHDVAERFGCNVATVYNARRRLVGGSSPSYTCPRLPQGARLDDARRALAGDPAHLEIAVRVARSSHRRYGIPLDEATCLAFKGLCRAALRYDGHPDGFGDYVAARARVEIRSGTSAWNGQKRYGRTIRFVSLDRPNPDGSTLAQSVADYREDAP